MAVSKKDRRFRGRVRDRKKSAIDQIPIDLFGVHRDSPAYCKDRSGEQPVEDKMDKKE